LTRGGLITTETTGSKAAGTLTLRANEAIAIVGTDGDVVSGLYSTTTGDGDGGRIVVSAPLLSVRGGVVDTGTGSKGRGGDILVDAGSVFLGIDDSGRPGRIIAPAYGRGATNHGGDIFINASRAILDGGFISTSTEQGASGDAGNIRVQADQIRLLNGGSIRTESTGAANAGNITVLARDVLRADTSSITTQADQAAGGNIRIDAASVQLFGSRVTASVARGAGGGGNVTINSKSFAALQGSGISARADQGFGGDIFINAEVFLRTENVLLDASSNLVGNSGLVQINTPALNISGDIAELPASFLDVSALLTKRCAVRAQSKASTFVVVGRGAPALDPDAPMWERYGEVLQTGSASAASKVHASPRAVSSGECGE
jgi:large exoprotein involved in heme utilization and adhesion